MRYNPTFLPLIMSCSLIALFIFAILATFTYSKTYQGTLDFDAFSYSIYSFFSFAISGQIAELFRLLLFRYLIRTNSVLAYDAGNIHVTSLLFANYRKLITKHWSSNLLKVIVFFEIGVWAIIVLLIYYAVRIISLA